VDDIATAVHHTQQGRLLDLFNSFHPRFQFTMEVGEGKLDFFDVTIINNNNRIEFDWFHKPTFSGRFLSFLSAHPLSQKKGTLIMIDRAFLLAHPRFHLKNLNFIINTFISNDYPIDFIFNTINSRLRRLIKKKTCISSNKIDNNVEKIHWFTVPYFPNISEKCKCFIKSPNVKLSFYSLNKLDNIIRAQKDHLENFARKNVVYKICCKDCEPMSDRRKENLVQKLLNTVTKLTIHQQKIQ